MPPFVTFTLSTPRTSSSPKRSMSTKVDTSMLLSNSGIRFERGINDIGTLEVTIRMLRQHDTQLNVTNTYVKTERSSSPESDQFPDLPTTKEILDEYRRQSDITPPSTSPLQPVNLCPQSDNLALGTTFCSTTHSSRSPIGSSAQPEGINPVTNSPTFGRQWPASTFSSPSSCGHFRN